MPTRVSPAIKKKLAKAQGIRLDVGCGNNKQPNYVGMDQRRLPGVDIVHDITKTPWPLPDGICLVQVLHHVWEHIPPWKTLEVMAEMHRVSRKNGIILMSAPYGLGYRFVQDPTHCNPSNELTFAYWDPLHPSGLYGVYEPPPMHIEAFEVVPAGGDRDFEVAMRVCKGTCAHGR